MSMLGTRLSDTDVVRDVKTAGTSSPVTVLPVAGVFGANASGKSTVLRAMSDMRAVVLGSFRRGDHDTRIRRYPFLLQGERECPSRFAIDVILSGVRWQYGFEIDDHRVLGEYAYYFPKGRQALVFRREQDRPELQFGPMFRSSGPVLARLVRRNALLLSVVGAAVDASFRKSLRIIMVTAPLFAWFRSSFLLAESANRLPRIAATADRAQSQNTRVPALSLLRAADLGITDIDRSKPNLDPEAAELLHRAFRIIEGVEDSRESGEEEQIVLSDIVRLNHMGRDGPVSIEPEHESQGTLVWISLIGPVLDALIEGAVVLVDELDASLHPHLAQLLVRLFQNHGTNPRGAQLIFNAHDTTVLGDSSRSTLGRDQVWLAEKAADGATTLYALAEFRPKRDEAVGRRYLQGRYGAVPILDLAEFQEVMESMRS